MSPSDHPPIQESLERVGPLLNRIAGQKLEALASQMPCDPALLSRFTTGKGAVMVGSLDRLMRATRLRMIDEDRVCAHRDELAMLRRVYATVALKAPHLLEASDL